MSVRVKILLSKIFNDYRKEAFILLKDSDHKYVRDFENHIKKLFNIQFDIYSTIGNSLLPSCEHISVIHSGDTIIINKRSEEISNNVNEFSQLSLEVENQSNDEMNQLKRGKRIRKRRKKQTTGKGVEVSNIKVDESIVQPDKSKQLLSEAPLTTYVASVSETTNSHIRFSDETTGLPSSNEMVSSEYVDVLKARVIRPVTVLSNANAESLNGDSQASTKLLCTQKCQQGIVSLKEIANDKNFAEIAASIDFQEIIKNIDDSIEFVPPKDEPKIYDVIAFKMLKIGKNYEPQLSEWIIAMVKDVEDINIVLHILAGHEKITCPDGKFSIAMTICEEETELSDMLTVKREDLLNVKVFYNK